MDLFSNKKTLLISLVFSFIIGTGAANASTILVVNNGSNSVSLLNEKTGKTLAELPTPFGPHEVAVTPNGKYALVSIFGTEKNPGSTLVVIDIENAKITKTIQLEVASRPHGIQFISDSQALVTAGGIQSLLLVDFVNGNTIKTIPLPGEGAHMVTTDAENHYAYVTNAKSGDICKVDLVTYEIQTMKIGVEVEGVALTPDEQLLLVTDRSDNMVAVLRAKNLCILKKIKTDLGPSRVAVLNDGNSAIVTNSTGGTAQMINLSTFTIDPSFKTTTSVSTTNGLPGANVLPVPISIAVREDQTTAFITNNFAGNITLVDMKSGAILRTLEAKKQPDGLAISKISNIIIPY
jgi:DNA-binding beta-propeller fold protein YncE